MATTSTGFYPFWNHTSYWFRQEENLRIDSAPQDYLTQSVDDQVQPGYHTWVQSSQWQGPNLSTDLNLTEIRVRVKFSMQEGYYRPGNFTDRYWVEVNTNSIFPNYISGSQRVYANWDTVPQSSFYDENLYQGQASGDPRYWGDINFNPTPEQKLARWFDVINGYSSISTEMTLDSDNIGSVDAYLYYIEMEVEYEVPATKSVIMLGSFH